MGLVLDYLTIFYFFLNLFDCEGMSSSSFCRDLCFVSAALPPSASSTVEAVLSYAVVIIVVAAVAFFQLHVLGGALPRVPKQLPSGYLT
jgi:hypothetical protein